MSATRSSARNTPSGRSSTSIASRRASATTSRATTTASRRKRWSKAIAAYRKAIELYPDHASARHNLALLYGNIGREEEAIPLYEDLRQRRMAFPITYTNLAGVYQRLGQYDKAYAVLQEYVSANPEVPRGHQGLGSLLSTWGRWDEALAAFDKASALEPANLSPIAAKGPTFVVTDRWDEYAALNRKLQEEQVKAEAELTRLRQQLPSERIQRASQVGHTALMAHDRGDAETAIRELKQAEPLTRPGESNTEYFFELGSAYLETGKGAEAAPYFERIVNSGTLRAGDPVPFVRSLYFLGQISERKGDRAKATEYYRRFVLYLGRRRHGSRTRGGRAEKAGRNVARGRSLAIAALKGPRY